jgi:hypothetical protein
VGAEMVTIRKRNGRWHVQIRKVKARTQSRTFAYRKDAEIWARDIERQIELEGCVHSKRQLLTHSFIDLLAKYEAEEGKHKKSYHVEQHYLHKLGQEPFAQLPLTQIGPEDIQKWVSQQRQSHKPSSNVRQLGLISRVFNVTIKRWGYPMDNPTRFVTKPSVQAHISRALKQIF